MSLKANVIANFAGQGWRALMALAFVPVYIRILGLEAFGLIGLFAALQLWLSLLDLGVRPVLSREAARFMGGAHDGPGFWAILRTAEGIALAMAVLAALAVAALSPWLATHWVNPRELSSHEVAQAFMLMGVVAAIQMLESLYASVLGGLQRQVALNAVQSAAAGLRALGAVAVLAWVSDTVAAFFLWQAVASALSALALGLAVYRSLRPADARPRFALAAIRPFAGYAGGMVAITLLSIAVTQLDKLILAGQLPLAEFGHYALATSVAGAIGMLAAPVGAAFYPRFAEQIARGDELALARTFRLGTQLAVCLAATGAVLLALFGARLIYVWTGDPAVAQSAGLIVTPLAIGVGTQAIVSLPYLLQLASGWTQLAIWLNIALVIVLVPSLSWAAPHYGAVGAAWTWAAINLAYGVLSPAIMFRRLLPAIRLRWLIQDLAMPLCAAAAAGLLWLWLVPQASRWLDLALLVAGGGTVLLAAVAASSLLRGLLVARLGPGGAFGAQS